MGPGEKEEGKAGPSDLKSESLGVKGTCGSSAGSPLSRGSHQPPISAGGWPCCSCGCTPHSQMQGAQSPPCPGQGHLLTV